MRRLALPALAVAAALALGGCGSSGRDLRDPEPGAVSPTRSAPTTTGPITTLNLGTAISGVTGGSGVPGSGVPGSGVPGTAARGGSLRLTTSAFTPGGGIPSTYSCSGPSPDLAWSGVPDGTAELALVVNDPTAGNDGFVHWVVVGIPGKDGSVSQGATPTGAKALANGAGNNAWFGPCPPAGSPHTYEFTLYALPKAFAAPSNANAKQVAAAIAEQANASTVLTGTYQR